MTHLPIRLLRWLTAPARVRGANRHVLVGLIAATRRAHPGSNRVELRPRNHGRLRECLRYEAEHDCIRVGFHTGFLERSARLGENCGINALTGELTAWIPEPEDAEFEQEWPSKWEPYGLLEHHEDEE